MKNDNWTIDSNTGLHNSSELFILLCEDVERIIRDGAYFLISGKADIVARTIVGNLAHKHKMRPME